MSRAIYDYPYHTRKNAFGKVEQHRERKFNGYIADLQLYAEGFMTPVRALTRKKSGIIDTELIKNAVNSMLDNRNYQSTEREYYFSFLYCAMALLSVEYEYTYEDSVEFHAYSFPSGIADLEVPTFRNLVKDADLIVSEDGVYGFEFCTLYSDQFCELYYLLCGKEPDIPTLDITPDITSILSPEELQDLFEEMDSCNPYSEADGDDFSDNEDEAGAAMTAEDAHEANILSGNKVKLTYPGYQDYITQLDTFIRLFDLYKSTDFFDTIRGIVSDFLVSNGYSLFSNETDYFEAMVSINKARLTLHKFMR